MLGLVALCGCQDNLYYSSFQDISQHRWNDQDTVVFSLPPSEKAEDVTVTLALRTTSSFHYNDVVVRAELLENDSLISSQSVMIVVNGEAESTRQDFLHVERYSRRSPLHMKAQASYTLRITHAMRQNPLEDVSGVGIFVEKKGVTTP